MSKREMVMNLSTIFGNYDVGDEQQEWLKTNLSRQPQELSTEGFLWYGKYNKHITANGSATCSCCNGKLFNEANYKDYPIWVVEYDCTKGEKYLVMDGKHRINKAIADGETTIKAYVYTLAELETYVNSK
tara:strand:- start:187 stop:576 length:390 start_codon:yes stop_codon:yes gene_type:complete